MTKEKYIVSKRSILITIVIIITFNTFRFTPFHDIENLTRFALTILGIFLFVIRYNQIETSIRNWIWIFTIVNIFSIINGYTVLGQNLISNIISNIKSLMIFSIIPFYFTFRHIRKNENTLKKIFIALAWFQLIAFSIIGFGGFEIIYNSIFSDTLMVITAKKIAKFFIQWAVFYFFIRYIKGFGAKSLFLFAVFMFIPILYDLKRLQLIFMLITISFILWQYKRKVATFITILSASLFLLLYGILNFNSISQSETVVKYSEAFKIFEMNPYIIQDKSTKHRIREVTFVIEEFPENWATGIGLARNSTKQEVTGSTFFYPVDVGVLGIAITSGILGIIVFLFQFFSLWKLRKNKMDNLFYESIFYFTLYLMIYSIGNANLFYNPNIFLLLMAILLGIREIYSNNEDEEMLLNEHP